MKRDAKGQNYPDEIDRSLRRVYEDVLNEDLPEQIMSLVDQLRKGGPPGHESGDGA